MFLFSIEQVHLRGRPTEENLDLRAIAFETSGYTGAQLANLVNTAGGFVGKEGRELITKADLLHVRPLVRIWLFPSIPPLKSLRATLWVLGHKAQAYTRNTDEFITKADLLLVTSALCRVWGLLN